MNNSSFAAPRRLLVFLLLVTTISVQAQTPAAKSTADSSSVPLGFSIESEMLTYRALESNSEAVACDITGYLNGTSPVFPSPPTVPVCEVNAGSHNASVVLLPFDKSTFADFQIWRADMAAMEQLQNRAKTFGCPPDGTRGAAAASAASSALNLTPAGPMINAAQGVLGLLASEEATSPVKGTVEDQAFLDSVGRQLRVLKVPVIMPTGYSPYSLMPLDREDSPFLVSLDRTLKAEVCMARLAANNSQDSESIRSTIAEIEKFRDMLEDLTMAKPAAAAAKTPGGSTATPATPGESMAAPTTATVTPAASSDHLHAVLFADGLARALGVDATGKIPDGGASQHILLLKALESGGAVSRSSNIMGTKMSYSGGFVGSYALFTMDGALECSGNVFEFGGPIKAKHFDKELNKYSIEPGKQVIFQRGGCLASTPRH
jgi:hypothetical protein